jgi:hypothetical protein
MVNDGPKKAAHAEGEEKDEPKQPGETELHRRDKRAHKTQNQPDYSNPATEQR